MGIQSDIDLSGTIVNGVTLGIPAITETGQFHWDGGVPEGVVDDVGVFAFSDPETPDVPITELGTVSFPQWTQPEGAHDALKEKVVVEHEGVLWVSLISANVWEPGVSGWRRFSEDPNAIQPWVQPTGAHDAYPMGAKVTHNGQTWENTGSAANVWEPGVFGWVIIG
jgi:hypothetical protein